VSEEFGPDDAPRAGENPEDRLPPQDVHAEQSVLGGMLLSKDAIADVVEAAAPARLLPARPTRRCTTPILDSLRAG
jgi:hypothetical protein